MHDIKYIRENPDDFVAAMARHKISPWDIIENDKKHRNVLTNLQALQGKRNALSRKIGEIKKADGDADVIMAEVESIKKQMAELEADEKECINALNSRLLTLPNILDADIPDGADETDNQHIRSHGDAPQFTFTPRDHVALGEALGMMDFAAGAKLSGARFVVLKDELARLERGLASFMLDSHTAKFGYQEILPPALVKGEILQGTGQLPKFADDLFKTTDDRWLIPTAEVPLTNLVAGEILNTDDLPLRMTAYTQCFRAEAGSAGRDTRGMIRQHQFSKVELVSITHPDNSADELNRMTNCAEEILKRLGLSYRVMLLCSGDTGFSAKRTHDIEVWLPGQDDGKGMYREISSCSNCGDFQARRMKARFRKKGEKDTQFVHTLNGSGLAIGRTMIAILENYQQEDGSIRIPEALQPYMGGLEVISADNK
ncbi:MAG: serine--tRNA ligase [Candidatus Puniceispirillales bacterium WSBS_2018_MAG_OTU23]